MKQDVQLHHARLRVERDTDYRDLFLAVPMACMVLGRDLRVVDANPAYLRMLTRDLTDLVGRSVAEAFPDDPGGRRAVTASLEQVVATRRPHRLPLVRFDTEVELGSGRPTERWWSAVHLPVLDTAGSVSVVLHAVEDVTEVVRSRDLAEHEQTVSRDLLQRTRTLEADLQACSRELIVLTQAEAAASRQLTGLAGAALALAAAATVDDLVDVVLTRGLAALGAVGGTVAVLDDDRQVLRATATNSPGPGAGRSHGEIALGGPLPISVVARTGRLLLSDERAATTLSGTAPGDTHDGPAGPSWAVLPLQAGPSRLGSLALSWAEPQDFARGQVELVTAFAAQLGQVLGRLRALHAEREAAAATRRWSHALQHSLLSEPPAVERMDIAVRYRPAADQAHVVGDWYDAFTTVAGKLTLVIADVAGHDRDAAVAMGQVRGVLRGVAQSVDGPPATVLATLDHALEALFGHDRLPLVSAVLCQVHDEVGTDGGAATFVRWSNAGHPPPLVIDSHGAAAFLGRPPDPVLGVDPGTDRVGHQVRLSPGSTLVLYTDGLVERRGESLDQGLARLLSTCEGLGGFGAEDVCDTLLRRLGADAEDDVALLVLRLAPAPATIGDGGTLVLAPDPAAVRTARDFVRTRCTAQGVDDDRTDLAVLLASEVVTNAFSHGRSRTRLGVSVSGGRLRVEVQDGNPAHPQRLEHDVDALNGRGVEILDLVATAWGVRPEAGGKTVWFELALRAGGTEGR